MGNDLRLGTPPFNELNHECCSLSFIATWLGYHGKSKSLLLVSALCSLYITGIKYLRTFIWLSSDFGLINSSGPCDWFYTSCGWCVEISQEVNHMTSRSMQMFWYSWCVGRRVRSSLSNDLSDSNCLLMCFYCMVCLLELQAIHVSILVHKRWPFSSSDSALLHGQYFLVAKGNICTHVVSIPLENYLIRVC